MATSSLSSKFSSSPTVTGPTTPPGLNTFEASFLKILASLYLFNSGGMFTLAFSLDSILMALTCFLWSLLIICLSLSTSSLILFLKVLLSSSFFILQYNLFFKVSNSPLFATPFAKLLDSLFSMADPTRTLSLSLIPATSIHTPSLAHLNLSCFLTKFSTSRVPKCRLISSPKKTLVSSRLITLTAMAIVILFRFAVVSSFTEVSTVGNRF